jgi:hypothetical protein
MLMREFPERDLVVRQRYVEAHRQAESTAASLISVYATVTVVQ